MSRYPINDEDISTYIKELLVVLDFVGNVPVGHKICVRLKCYSDPKLWSTSPIRYLNGEDASRSCDFIERTIKNLEDVLREYKSSDHGIRKILIEKSKVFRQGLVHLIDTYSSNPEATSRLRSSLTILDLRVPCNKESHIGGVSAIISDETFSDNITQNQISRATPSIFDGE